MGGGMNPGGIPMQRGVTAQAHQQQQVQSHLESKCFVVKALFPISDVSPPTFFDSWEEKTQEWEWVDTPHSKNRDACEVYK